MALGASKISISSTSPLRVIAAASIGNALEWFDLLVYGYFTLTISRLFFPSSDQTVSLMLGFGTFGASYLVRPLGALVIGAYADKAGRKASLMVSVFLMTIGTLLMAIVPTYAIVGSIAPATILIARLIQGFSVGGEFGGSTSFLVEHGGGRKGFFASFQWAGQGLAAVLASLFGVGLSTLLTPDQVNAWGWRVPYFFGLLIGPVGFYIRRHADETPEFLAAKPTPTPVRELILEQWDRVLLAIGIAIVSNSSNYLILYMPTFAVTQLNLPASSGFIATLAGGVILTIGSPVIGHWSDLIGRTRIMLVAAALFLVSAYPAFLLVTRHASLPMLIGVVCWLSLLKTTYSAVLPALMAELFPTQTRCTGMALSYNLSVPIFGGFAPLISTGLIQLTGNSIAPSFYLMATALASFCVLLLVRRQLSVSDPTVA
jgi:MHS family proline/betaine transporter-like MFS transporter